MHPLAAQLLELQVQHELQALAPEPFLRDARELVNDIFAEAENTRLNQVMSPQQIMGVIQRNVVALEINGGLIELIGEAVEAVRAHILHSDTKVQDVIDRGSFEDYANKVFDLFQDRGELLEPILATPIYTEIVSDILLAVLNQYFRVAHQRGLSLPLIGSLLDSGEKWVGQFAPDFSTRLEENVKHFTVKNLKWLISKSQNIILDALSDPDLRDSVLNAWDEIRELPVAPLDDAVQSLDLNEFVVIGYEHWKRFRKSPLLIECCDTVVQYLFDKYGDEPLALLLEEVGITTEQVMIEIEALVPPALQALIENGFIEAQLRKRLSRFYQSEAVNSLLTSAP